MRWVWEHKRTGALATVEGPDADDPGYESVVYTIMAEMPGRVGLYPLTGVWALDAWLRDWRLTGATVER